MAETVKEYAPRRRFAHESEAEFARFLDFYNIEWRYEPVCFPIARNGDGTVKESFTPDFYLPQFELFIELTTMKQSLVTKKNRKIRLMRELYPEIRVKILYRRDYRKLLFKFGALG
jgi:hypoxanthine phosphoribosyltransferase